MSVSPQSPPPLPLTPFGRSGARRGAAGRRRPSAGRRFRVTLVLLLMVLLAIVALAATGANAAHATTPHARPAGATAPARDMHIETWAFDDDCNGGLGASPALVREWVTYAESDCGPTMTKARTDCHAGATRFCLVMQYLDTDWNFPVEHVGIRASAAGWWLHDPAPRQRDRIASPNYGVGHLLNQDDPAVRSFFRSYARRNYDADDGLMLDWQSPSLIQELYYASCHCQTTSEVRSDAALQAGHEAMSAALTHRSGAPFIQADNTLPPNPYTPQGLNMLDRAAGVDGWIVEGEPVDYDTFDPYYSTLLDQIAFVANRTQGFVAPMARAAAGASYQQQSRRVAEATMLLGYSPGHLVDWSNLETGSDDLAIWPEEGIYPTDPVESMVAPGGAGCLAGTGAVCTTGGHNDLEVAPGIYRREFATCYDLTHPIGPCAAIVDATGRPVTVRPQWLSSNYRHLITFTGGDVQSGGTIDLTGAPFAAGSSVVAGDDALLLTR
ncbi:MAG: hypothetical protein ABSH51_26390 [Solirubrobacteraceae bacterium]|jgi:hypothetical protein